MRDKKELGKEHSHLSTTSYKGSIPIMEASSPWPHLNRLTFKSLHIGVRWILGRQTFIRNNHQAYQMSLYVFWGYQIIVKQVFQNSYLHLKSPILSLLQILSFVFLEVTGPFNLFFEEMSAKHSSLKIILCQLFFKVEWVFHKKEQLVQLTTGTTVCVFFLRIHPTSSPVY